MSEKTNSGAKKTTMYEQMHPDHMKSVQDMMNSKDMVEHMKNKEKMMNNNK